MKLSIVDDKGAKRRKCDFTIDKDKVILGDIEIDKSEISSPNIVFTNVVEFFTDKNKYRIKADPKKHTSITLMELMLKRMVQESKKNINE